MIADLLRKLGVAAPLEYAGQTAYGLVHPTVLRSGATVTEQSKALPSDAIIPHPSYSATRCVTIDAPRESVWPWLVQMGYGRGGWYGWYPFDIPHDQSSQSIVAEYQSLSVGDVMLDGPGCDRERGAFTVTELIPGNAIVLHSCRDVFTGQEVRSDRGYSKRYADMTWVFVLQALTDNRTRLLVRTRVSYSARWLGVPVALVFGPGDTVMQRNLMFGIKRRSEAHGPRRVPADRFLHESI